MYEHIEWRISKGFPARRLFCSSIKSRVSITCSVLDFAACCIANLSHIADTVDEYDPVKWRWWKALVLGTQGSLVVR